MDNVISCPSCQNKLKISEEYVGRSVRCPKCQEVFTASVSPPPQVQITPSPPPMPSPQIPTPEYEDEDYDDQRAYDDDYRRPRRQSQFDDEDEYDDDDDYRRPRRRPRYDDYDDYGPTRRPPLRRGVELSGRATAAIVCVGLSMVLEVAGILADLNTLSFLNNPIRLLNINDANRVDAISGAVGLAQIAVLILGAIFVCMWFYRAHENLRLFRTRRLQYSPGWAAGAFFVPILNLFRPYQIAQEIYKASDPYGSPTEWRHRGGSGLIVGWWIMWIVSGIVRQIAFRMINPFGQNPPSIETLKSAMYVSMFGSVTAIAAGFLVIFVIRSITSRQEEKYRRLRIEAAYPEEDEY